MYIKAKEARKIALSNMHFQWGASLLALCIYAALLACGNAIPVIGAVVISGPLLFGLYWIYFEASKKEKINYWDIFKGFETQFGDTFLANILVGVYTFLWSLLFVIPGIIKKYSYAMYMYLLLREPELTAPEAIDKSREYMSGNKWRLFCLELSFIGWTILECITCGILAVYVEPYKMHAKMAFFNDLYEKKNNPDYTTDIPEAENVDPQFVVDAEVKPEANDDKTIDPQFIVQPEDDFAAKFAAFEKDEDNK